MTKKEMAQYVKAKFDHGENEIAEGRGIVHEKAVMRLKKWVKTLKKQLFFAFLFMLTTAAIMNAEDTSSLNNYLYENFGLLWDDKIAIVVDYNNKTNRVLFRSNDEQNYTLLSIVGPYASYE